jgi:methylmalonyl-CoA/ethylmalonyl-CoA epimerase
MLPAGLLRTGRARLHHLGYVVAAISTVAEAFAESIAARWDGRIIHDPLQRVRVAFFKPVEKGNPVFELVEPACDASPISRFLKSGGGLHHVCYEIDDLEWGLKELRRAGFVMISPPKPAPAFGGRRIAWIYSKSRVLMELLERKPK